MAAFRNRLLFELLPQCDLYLSASSYESYSMATAEAVAHGLPVLAYATGAIGDWIEDGVNGMLIELGKPEQFFQALRRLLTERHALNQLRHNAWARTANLTFNSWDKTYRRFPTGIERIGNLHAIVPQRGGECVLLEVRRSNAFPIRQGEPWNLPVYDRRVGPTLPCLCVSFLIRSCYGAYQETSRTILPQYTWE